MSGRGGQQSLPGPRPGEAGHLGGTDSKLPGARGGGCLPGFLSGADLGRLSLLPGEGSLGGPCQEEPAPGSALRCLNLELLLSNRALTSHCARGPTRCAAGPVRQEDTGPALCPLLASTIRGRWTSTQAHARGCPSIEQSQARVLRRRHQKTQATAPVSGPSLFRTSGRIHTVPDMVPVVVIGNSSLTF